MTHGLIFGRPDFQFAIRNKVGNRQIHEIGSAVDDTPTALLKALDNERLNGQLGHLTNICARKPAGANQFESFRARYFVKARWDRPKHPLSLDPARQRDPGPIQPSPPGPDLVFQFLEFCAMQSQ
jgi:hypothetical protein